VGFDVIRIVDKGVSSVCGLPQIVKEFS